MAILTFLPIISTWIDNKLFFFFTNTNQSKFEGKIQLSNSYFKS